MEVKKRTGVMEKRKWNNEPIIEAGMVKIKIVKT